MKTINFICITLFIFLIGCTEQKKSSDVTEKSSEQTQKIEITTINVNSLICVTCKKTVTEALNKVDGVQKVDVDVDKKIARISFFPAKTTLAILEKAITEAGYNANDKKRNEDAYNNLPECCKKE